MADQLLGGIVINEILVDPNGATNFDTDGNGTAGNTDEYVELYNASNTAIDISGLELWDQGVGQWFIFPAGTVLQPGGHAMVLSGVQTGGSLPTGGADDLFFDAGRGSPLINNGGDNVTLYDPANDEYVQATFNGDAFDDPTTYTGFSGTATQVGAGEDFGTDTDGESLQRTGDGEDTFGSDAPTPGTTNVCFADGTRLRTPTGDIAIEDLQAGDVIMTADKGAQSVVWTYQKTWTHAQVKAAPNLAAVLIRAGALGVNHPSRDLRLSQQHRVLVQGPIAHRMFGADEVLVPAKALLVMDGVSLEVPEIDVTYYHIMLNHHEVVFANGVASESLFLGKEALRSIPDACIDDICAVLDIDRDAFGDVAPARPFAKGRRAERLIVRHDKNNHPVSGSSVSA